VLVHHDFAQTPDFSIDAPNAFFVPDPKRTGWGCWGFSEGIFHALGHAVERLDFDYLQLLSPTCLPIKPMSAFEAHVAQAGHDAHFDYVDLFDDEEALMSVGYRAFSPEHTLRHRVLRRLSVEYFGGARGDARREIAGIQLRTGVASNARGRPTALARLARLAIGAASRRRIGRHVFDDEFRPCFGSVWFGARREVVERMLERFADPAIPSYFSRLRIPDELLVPSLLRASARRRGPANHLVSPFVEAHPCWFAIGDLDRLRHAKAYFARKFHDSPTDPIRRWVLDQLVRDAGTGLERDSRTPSETLPSARD
jgi:hypothetical protein